MAWNCGARVWFRQELWCAGTRAPRSSLYTQQRNGFRRQSQKSDPQRPNSETGTKPQKSGLSPPVQDPVFHTPSRSVMKLVKPFFFTVGFSGFAFGSAAVWQYEAIKSKVQNYFKDARADWMDKMRPQKGLSFRKQINLWWNSLTNGQRAVSANMYVLWSFSTSIVSLLGREQFMAVYLSAGVVSTFASYVFKVATGRFGPSLGASGAIMTVLAAVCTKMPEARLAIIFLPMFTFTAGNALKAIIAMDSAGLVLGWKFFDHAAHLGGALFGIWYVTYGNRLIWKKREPVVKFWHAVRTWSPKK